jgi:protein-disulfide isomerase
VKTSPIGKAARTAVLLAAVIGATTRVTHAQSQADQERRLAALEETQKAILQELREIRMLLQQQLKPAPAPAPPPSPTQPPVPDLSVADAATRGNPSAKVTIIEFSDFECPFCARFQRDTFAQLNREYVDTGKVRYVFRHYPIAQIHPNATKAAEAAECARMQGKFWEYHDRLFSNPKQMAVTDLTRHATEIGLNVPSFEQCLGGQASAMIKNDLAEGSRAGMGGTPTFFIGTTTPDGKVKVLRRLVGAQQYTAFKAALDALLAAAP